MVAKTPPKQKKMEAALNPALLRDTVQKMDRCVARLQELQFTVAGGTKVVTGVCLSPRSTRGYLKTSLRCKQESFGMRNGSPKRSQSPIGKFPQNKRGEWQRMSLPAMLLGETIGEILQASQFAREIVTTVGNGNTRMPASQDPKTPLTHQRKHRPNHNHEFTELGARRRREKQLRLQSLRLDHPNSPSLQRARSRISFKSPPHLHKENDKENFRYLAANRVSPRNRPWAKKTVLFPNPMFHLMPPSNQSKLGKTRSPVRQPLHKFLIKSPTSNLKHGVRIRSPTVIVSPTRPKTLSKNPSPKRSRSAAAKLRRSLSPARLASKLVSPLRSSKGTRAWKQ